MICNYRKIYEFLQKKQGFSYLKEQQQIGHRVFFKNFLGILKGQIIAVLKEGID